MARAHLGSNARPAISSMFSGCVSNLMAACGQRQQTSGQSLQTLWRTALAVLVKWGAAFLGGNRYHARFADSPASPSLESWSLRVPPLHLKRSRMRPLHYYLVGTSSWFLAFGMQSVLFAWLLIMVLRESPEMVGVAQMTLLLPGTLLILAGGGLADRYGGRRMAMAAQSGATLAPLILLLLVALERLSFSSLLLYALVMGCAQAFVTPARDGLLNQVAEGRIQRAVMLVSMVQFGTQIIGSLVAALADKLGAALILGIQAAVLAGGLWGFRGIVQTGAKQEANRDAGETSLLRSILEGSKAVLRHRSMRTVALLNFAMGLFFMGAYIVTLPLFVREVFNGAAADLGMMNICNLVGLVSAILLLLRIGDLARQGRALILAQFTGALVLGLVAMAPSFPIFLGILFFWGACGGVSMTMARTIMQEQALEAQRGRVMAFHWFSFMGAGPLGALLNGFLAEEVGAQAALGVSAAGMFAVMLLLGFRSQLWRMKTTA